jgi:Lrp/AsnC family transcriptional regulator for asnA, asnC and gidA
MVRNSEISNRRNKTTDLAIIYKLMENSRKSFVEIAKELNVTETAIRKRVRRMESEGVIRKYSIEIDPKNLGFGVKSLIGIDTTPQRYISIIQTLKRNEKILKLYSSSGDHMMMIECWFESNEELHNFINELENIEGVLDICPTIITDYIK